MKTAKQKAAATQPRIRKKLVETHVVGRRTRESTVRAERCPALGLHRIAHVGVADAALPYEMVRTHLSGAYFLACVGGQGRILLDGRWQICREGMACLAPPHVLHAFHTVARSRWEFCWVRYEHLTEQQPIISSTAPVMARFDGRSLQSAIMGLYYEVESAAAPSFIHQWIELIQSYVARFAQPWHVEDRLSRVWETVADHLGESWTLDRLSRESHFSGEHLRRLCRRQLGRSPMQHVTYLRMQRAASLLTATPDKIEAIASAVGYENPFVFSNTFKKWIGWRPSNYRLNKHQPETLRRERPA